MPVRINIPAGTRFGNVIATTGERIRIGEYFYLECRCNCGKIFKAKFGNLRTGNTTSCGCMKLAATTKHGLHDSAEHTAWTAMKQRCHNPKNPGYRSYGNRGITVCKEWQESFIAFYRDMGPRPT